ncbi:MAG: hypothetical protein HY851_06115, partial [candidate division Zixibacteria bacterium]|nr:hypothetical protein [candidate division Zixibacteria bacterium]
MKVILYACLISIMAVSAATAQPFLPDNAGLDQYELIDSALAQVGLTRERFTFDQDEMKCWGGDSWRLSFFTMLHQSPFKLPKHAELTMTQLGTDAANPTSLVSFAARKIDVPLRRGLIGDPLEKYTKFPDSTPHMGITASRNFLSGPEYARLCSKIDLIWEIANDKEFSFSRAIADIDNGKNRKRLLDFFVHEKDDDRAWVEELVGKVDFNLLMAGAEDLVEAARRAADSVEFCTFPAEKYEMKTRKGLIVVGTKGNDNYEYLEAPLLIIDGGGNDTYKFPMTSIETPYSVIVDAGGSDRYISTDSTTAGFGGAIIGGTVLIDKAGDDTYETMNASLGTGILGVGVLIDNQGRDTYSGRH